MAIEREKKYLVKGNAVAISATAVNVIGVVQWYTSIMPEYEERIRIVVHTNGVANIYKTTKTDTGDPASRVEDEVELLAMPSNIAFSSLPAVLKIRHILLSPQGAKEAVLDHYLAGTLTGKYVLEIEADSGNIDEMAKSISSNLEDVTSKKEYKNKNLAMNINMEPEEAERFLRQALMGY